jgi:hypothetical protein
MRAMLLGIELREVRAEFRSGESLVTVSLAAWIILIRAATTFAAQQLPRLKSEPAGASQQNANAQKKISGEADTPWSWCPENCLMRSGRAA